MKFAFNEQHAPTWPVTVMCRMLGVSRSGCYDWRDRAPSVRTMANLALPGDARRSRRDIRGDTDHRECMPPCGGKAILVAVVASRG